MKAEPLRPEATTAAERMKRRARKADRLTANARKAERKKEEAKRVVGRKVGPKRAGFKKAERLRDVTQRAELKKAERLRDVPRRAGLRKLGRMRASLRLHILLDPDRATADQEAKAADTRAEHATRSTSRLVR